jgi:hypothetical protein
MEEAMRYKKKENMQIRYLDERGFNENYTSGNSNISLF